MIARLRTSTQASHQAQHNDLETGSKYRNYPKYLYSSSPHLLTLFLSKFDHAPFTILNLLRINIAGLHSSVGCASDW